MNSVVARSSTTGS